MADLDQALNEVDQMVSNGPEGSMMSEGKKAFYIVVKNGQSSAKKELLVYPENNLHQVITATASELGFDTQKGNNIFINERTGSSTVDMKTTLKEIQAMEHDVISIMQDGKVASCKTAN